ncbi:MAG: peptidase T [Oscillospiraceae bacterium]|nr:peptidase T [Oscillospiraceae bacterium]
MLRFHDAVKERLLRYSRIDSQSGTITGPGPSTPCQRDMAAELCAEMRGLGVSDVFFDESACVVYGRIPASPGTSAEPLAFITHMDTAPDVSGHGVRPWVLEAYDGGDILLNESRNIVMRVTEHPVLKNYVGQDLILTDGTTLLGGDDKAAIAAVMTLAEILLAHPELPHGPICLAFTPDEEVGGLARELDLERLRARFAYTLDGDHVGWYQDQTFNAAAAALEIRGVSVHTGTAKGLMINASDLAVEFLNMLPAREKPQFTDGVEGFYHVCSVSSSCEYARVELIVRDFDENAFASRLTFLSNCTEALNRRYGPDTAALTVREQYRNMGQTLSRHPFLTELLRQAITDCGLEPVCEPFRGGTDGAALTFRGLPCPNLSAGYENAHGRFEFVPIQSMEKNVEILLSLCRRWAEMGTLPDLSR